MKKKSFTRTFFCLILRYTKFFLLDWLKSFTYTKKDFEKGIKTKKIINYICILQIKLKKSVICAIKLKNVKKVMLEV